MTSALMESIIAQGDRLATHSWEYGTFAEALLEWYDPYYSVFGNNPFPDGKIPVADITEVRSLSYAQPHISTNSTTLVDGDGTLFINFHSIPASVLPQIFFFSQRLPSA